MIALTLLPLAVCLTANPAVQTPKVAAFHAIDVASGIEATVTRGPTSLKIEADQVP